MTNEINENAFVATLTIGQLKQALQIGTQQAEASTEKKDFSGENFVFGLHGICKLFNVSHVTAQRYKNTFLAPACIQRGRKIIVNVEKARQLFAEASKKGESEL